MRMYRKRARLTQEDVAFIASMPDYANVSRIETGLRQPDVEILLVYHLLFDMPIQAYFESMIGTFKEGIIERIKSRIEALAMEPKNDKMSYRIQFLQSLLAKLGIAFQIL
jgi:transcriptional regulator with XRE-family HTH domain